MSHGMNPFLKMPDKTWIQVGIAPIVTRKKTARIQLVGAIEPAPEPDIIIPVVGMRSDGCEFTIEVGIDSEKLGSISAPDCLLGMHVQLMMAFGKLETYRNCSCNKEIVCKAHQPPVQN